MSVTACRIRDLREKNKLTQKELGEAIGRVKNTIYNYENEIQSPTEKDLRAIAGALNTTVAYLVGDLDDSSIDALENSDFDTLMKEFGKEDPELVAMFRDTSKDWSDLSEHDKRVIIDGLRFVLGRAGAGKYLEDIPEDL